MIETAHKLSLEEKHIAFLYCLLNKCVFCPSGGKLDQGILHWPYDMHYRKKVALGTILLGTCYRLLSVVVSNHPFTYVPRTYWLVQLWLLLYFPNLWVAKIELPSNKPPRLTIASCYSEMTHAHTVIYFRKTLLTWLLVCFSCMITISSTSFLFISVDIRMGTHD